MPGSTFAMWASAGPCRALPCAVTRTHALQQMPRRKPERPRFSRNGCYGILDRDCPSFRLDVSGPDHLAPLLGFVSNVLGEVGGRAGKHRDAQVVKSSFDLWIGESRVDFAVELVDYLGGRIPGRADASPATCLEAR